MLVHQRCRNHLKSGGPRHRGTGGLGGYSPPLFSKINNNVLKRSKEFAND